MGGLSEKRSKNMIVYRCRAADCTNTVEAPPGLEAVARRAAEGAGWTFAWAPGGRFIGWCGRCGAGEAGQGTEEPSASVQGCLTCAKSPLHAALGHGSLEHRVANALQRHYGVDTVERARGLTPEDVMALPNLGVQAAGLLKARLG